MILEQNRYLSTVNFYNGYDVTADMLNAQEQYLDSEVINRTKDFMKYPGFSFGLKIGTVTGQSVTITQGVGFDQEGRRLEHPKDISYKISFPTLTSGTNTGYLCVRTFSKNISYRNHPYTGKRLPIETALGLEFYIDLNFSQDSFGNIYPSDNVGLIIGKLTIIGKTYEYEQVTNRSPFIAMKDGQ